MNILITGGTGFIGTALVNNLLATGNNISILTRNKSNVSNDVQAFENIAEISEDESIDVIINLAGAPISKRWTEPYKKELVNSRIKTTQNIISLIKKLKRKPTVLISASAIGYYGHKGNDIVDESSAPNDGFTHQLCKQWEIEALKAEHENVRVCIIRLGVVLGKKGGALKQMLPAFNMGLGGRLGDGSQFFSWVHIDDVISAINFLTNNHNQKGIYNLSSPNPITNIIFTKSLSKCLKRPSILPMPRCMIKFLFGQMGQSLLIDSIRVIPKKLESEGFDFQYPEIQDALKDILN